MSDINFEPDPDPEEFSDMAAHAFAAVAAEYLHRRMLHAMVLGWLEFRNSTPLFPLGKVVITTGVVEACEDGADIPVFALLARHGNGDWGDDLPKEDRTANSKAVHMGRRILSNYRVKDFGHVWIVTEADRSVTTVLLPEEY